MCAWQATPRTRSGHSGQGGSLALEDAIVLAKCLRDAPKVEAAFAEYQRIRKERAEHVAHQTRRIGDRKAPPGPIGRAVRDLVAAPVTVPDAARERAMAAALAEFDVSAESA